jgi:2'-5' RNA ligase
MGVPFTQKDEIHCTVVYSPDAVPAHIPVPKNMPIHAKGVGFELFGPDKDCVVLLLESSALKALNAKFVKAGAIPTYAEYRPHITIAKVDAGSGKKYPSMKFTPIDIELVSMTIEDIVKKND